MDKEKQFLDLYDASADALLRHCYFKTHDRELAKDLVQESFLRTWRSINAGDVPNPPAFLYRTANNLIIDHYRRKKALSLDELAEVGFDPVGEGSEEVESVTRAREAREAIEALEEPYRETMHLRYVSGFSVGEIAGMLEESENTISVRIHRALEKLKLALTP